MISVVVPTYNRANLLSRAIDSVLGQTYRDFDLWIIDDGSTDHTDEVVQKALKDDTENRVHYVRTENSGVASARNRGVRDSAGEWIAFLDSDDRWHPEKLARQIALIRRQPQIEFAHTGETWIRNGIRVNPPKKYAKSGGNVFEESLPVCMIGSSTVLLTRRLFEESGGFDEDFPVCEDYDLWLRITADHPVGWVDEPLTIKYGGHRDQLSTTHKAMDSWRIRSLCRIAALPGLTPRRRHAVITEIERKGQILYTGYTRRGRMKDREDLVALVRGVHPDFKPES